MVTSKEKMVGLKQLSKDGNSNVFRRVQLAAEILADREFVSSEWGDEFRAWSAMEDECFSMLKGLMPFARLLQIHQRFPTERHWLEYNYNLAVMDDLCCQAEAEERAKAGEVQPVATRRRATLEQVEKLEAENQALAVQVQELRQKVTPDDLDRVEVLEQENARLHQELGKLRQENLELRRQVQKLRVGSSRTPEPVAC